MEMLDNLGHLGVVLQLAIAPMILISGVGYVLSSLTDRYGRIVDVSRMFAGNIRDEQVDNRRIQLKTELNILLTRAKLVRASITFSVLSLLFISVLILSLFFMALLNLDLLDISVALFVSSLSVFTISLIFFILDVNLSLKALTLETESLK
ncbi:hypothetical protein SPONN_327 [uncultured Candidatus Thioglobus sp.]|nr:hypothetical protein SPONN_327 [uncultured Candidatus Thioglobus sp.]